MPAVLAPAILEAWGAFVMTMPTWAPAFATALSYAITISSVAAYTNQQRKSASRKLADAMKQQQGITFMARSASETRKTVYGTREVSGPIAFQHESGTTREYYHLVILLADHEINSVQSVMFGDDVLSLDGSGNEIGKYAGYIRVKTHLGSDSQTADADLVAESGGKWTTEHRLRGIAYLYFRLKYDQKIFPSGLQNISAIVQGKKVYDPRTSTTVFSNNPALVLNDVFISHGWASSKIDQDALIAAANICDEDVPLAAGGTQKRYTYDAVHDSATSLEDLIDQVRAHMAGSVVYSGGKWSIKAGAYEIPTVTLDESHMVGPIDIVTRLPRRSLCNRVKGQYVDPLNRYVPSDFTPITNSTYLAQDNGEELWHDIQLPGVLDQARAQRIAKIQLERTRQQISATIRTSIVGLRVKAGDNIMLTNSRLGWSSKVFEVVEWKLSLGDASNPAIGCEMQLRETAESVWAWSEEETIIDTAPDTELPDPWDVPAPATVTLTSGVGIAQVQPDGTVINRIRVQWSQATRANILNGGRVLIDYKLHSDSSWLSWTSDIRGDQVDDYITDVKALFGYDVRVAFENVLGARSNWTESLNHAVTGVVVTPSNPTAATLTASGINTAPDGTISSYLTFSVPALPSYAAKQVLVYKRSTDTDWLQASAPLKNTASAATVTIMDLTPGIIYAVATIALSSLDTPSATVAATSSPFTAPTKTTNSAVPLSITYTAGDSSSYGEPPLFSSIGPMFCAKVSWNVPSGSDVLCYQWVVTSTDSDSAADSAANPVGPGAQPNYVTEPKAIVSVALLGLTNTYFRVRSVSRSGVASVWAGGGVNLQTSYLRRPAGTITSQNSDALSVTGITTGTSSKKVLARYPIAFNRTFTGGNWYEDFTVTIPSGVFSAAPDVCVATLGNSGPWVVIYNAGGSSSTSAAMSVRSTDGSNIPAAGLNFSFEYIEYA